MTRRGWKDRLRNWTPRWRPSWFKATLVALPTLAIAIPLAVLAIPYLEILNDMAVQPKGKPQGQYGYFSDEALTVARPPVAGTLPMDFVPHPIPGNDEAARKLAEATLVNPLPRSRVVLERGRKIFNVYCIPCHGERALGNGAIVGPGLFPAPPSLHTKQAREFKDGRIYQTITRGQNKMPSQADVVDPIDRWAVTHYVRALQKAKQTMDEEGDR